VYFQKEESEELMMNEKKTEGSAMCLLCHEIVMGNKCFNLGTHHNTFHSNFESNFPNKFNREKKN
jgi:hypothetical protein